MPTGQFVITEVSSTGEPTTPERVLGPYKSVCGITIKDHVPITYILWTGERGDPHMVPDSINDILWPKILEKFDFPEEKYMKVVKCKMLMIMGLSFKNRNETLNRTYVQKGTTPDFHKWLQLEDH